MFIDLAYKPRCAGGIKDLELRLMPTSREEYEMLEFLGTHLHGDTTKQVLMNLVKETKAVSQTYKTLEEVKRTPTFECSKGCHLDNCKEDLVRACLDRREDVSMLHNGNLYVVEYSVLLSIVGEP
jgi:hypothetical protein